MSLFDELRELGVDIDDGLKRLGGNESLYSRLLGSFVKTMKEQVVDPDFDCNEYTETTERAHTIKGIAGNLSIAPVYTAYTEIVNLLRGGKPEEAKKVLMDVIPVQESIMQCIERNMK